MGQINYSAAGSNNMDAHIFHSQETEELEQRQTQTIEQIIFNDFEGGLPSKEAWRNQKDLKKVKIQGKAKADAPICMYC